MISPQFRLVVRWFSPKLIRYLRIKPASLVDDDDDEREKEMMGVIYEITLRTIPHNSLVLWPCDNWILYVVVLRPIESIDQTCTFAVEKTDNVCSQTLRPITQNFFFIIFSSSPMVRHTGEWWSVTSTKLPQNIELSTHIHGCAQNNNNMDINNRSFVRASANELCAHKTTALLSLFFSLSVCVCVWCETVLNRRAVQSIAKYFAHTHNTYNEFHHRCRTTNRSNNKKQKLRIALTTKHSRLCTTHIHRRLTHGWAPFLFSLFFFFAFLFYDYYMFWADFVPRTWMNNVWKFSLLVFTVTVELRVRARSWLCTTEVQKKKTND